MEIRLTGFQPAVKMVDNVYETHKDSRHSEVAIAKDILQGIKQALRARPLVRKQWRKLAAVFAEVPRNSKQTKTPKATVS
jgi:hypothetical protein